jgi:PAS domain S-box-containing protein
LTDAWAGSPKLFCALSAAQVQVRRVVAVVEQAVLRRSAHLDPVAVSAREARRVVREALTNAGETGHLDTAELAVSELVTNAILHAATPVELTVEVSQRDVRVSVRDYHAALPAPRVWGTGATTGRGLSLVASLTDEHGVEPFGNEGKAVWFRLVRSAPAAPSQRGGWDIAELVAELAQPAGSTVVLSGVPVRLWAAGQQHWEAVLRELYLLEHAPPHRAVPDLVAAGRALGSLSAAVERAAGAALRTAVPGSRLPTARLTPLPSLPEEVEARLTVLPDDHAGFGALQDALDLSVELGAAGQLLIRPALPEVIALRDWACEQVVAQVNGVPATPWAGTAHAAFETPTTTQLVPLPAWDADVVRTSSRSVVAADDNNRLVAVSPAAGALLGWGPDALTGRRVVAIVPPALREAHVAGFTRHLTTGETHAIGVPLQLPVLRADGTELLCDVLIERAEAEVGRAVYLCFIDPAG